MIHQHQTWKLMNVYFILSFNQIYFLCFHLLSVLLAFLLQHFKLQNHQVSHYPIDLILHLSYFTLLLISGSQLLVFIVWYFHQFTSYFPYDNQRNNLSNLFLIHQHLHLLGFTCCLSLSFGLVELDLDPAILLHLIFHYHHHHAN